MTTMDRLRTLARDRGLTVDAGTSEGAKKAAMTRAQHQSAATHHGEQAAHHQYQSESHSPVGGPRTPQYAQHKTAGRLHYSAMVAHSHATRHFGTAEYAEHAARAASATRAAERASSKVHDAIETRDPGVEKTMHEFKRGQLHSGSKKGPVVRNRKQAIAIALSQQRRGDAALGGAAKVAGGVNSAVGGAGKIARRIGAGIRNATARVYSSHDAATQWDRIRRRARDRGMKVLPDGSGFFVATTK
jgi:hypothetical protein